MIVIISPAVPTADPFVPGKGSWSCVRNLEGN